MPRSKSGFIRQQIGLRRGRLTSLIESSTALIDSVPTISADDITKREQVATAIDVLISKLETAVDNLLANNTQWQHLVESLDDDDMADEEKVYADFVGKENSFITLMDDGKELVGLLKVHLRRLRTTTSVGLTEAATDSTAAGDRNKRGDGRSRPAIAKLPKLTLPVFDGDYLLWSQFWSLFKANVDDADLHGVEKLSYLRGQLRGAALTAIDGVQITDDGYKIAVDILKERFERTADRLIGSLYSQLKRVPPSSNRVDDLQKTFDYCERIFRQLKSEGEDVDGNRSLIMDIMSKYPSDVLREISRRKGVGTHSTVGDVQTAFREFIDEASCIQGILGDLQPFAKGGTTTNSPQGHKFEGAKPSPKVVHGGSWNNDQSETSAFSTAGTGQQKSAASVPVVAPKPCYFCNGNHFNSQCDQYPTAELRGARLEAIRRCRRCMSSTHVMADCRTSNQRLRCFFCKASSHSSPLCPDTFGSPRVDSKPAAASTAATLAAADTIKKSGHRDNCGSGSHSSVATLCIEEQSVLSTATTYIINPRTEERRRVRVMFDSGSHRSYITEALAQNMFPDCNRSVVEPTHVAVFGTERTLSIPSTPVQFEIQLRLGGTMTINAHTTPLITHNSLSPGKLPDGTWQMLESMGDAMADNYNHEQVPPEVLIGNDYFWEFLIGTRFKTNDGIYLIPTTLGVVLGGRYTGERDTTRDIPSLLCLTERSSPSLTDIGLCAISAVSKAATAYPDVDEFWSLEKIGISDDPIEDDDTLAMSQFDKTVSYDGSRYHVCFPWKSNKHQLSTNRGLARGRLASLAKRLTTADDTVLKEYVKIINHQLEHGIIERVPPQEIHNSKNTVHYLSHHPVVKADNVTTKVRLVYDASAKCGNDSVSLNECLYRGPVILPDLCSVLLRFRLHKVALVADIEKAFLQICLMPSERDVTRFLWFKDPTKLTVDDDNIDVLRFARVPFGAICSPFLLGGVVQHHLRKVDSDVAHVINDNIYVDNVIAGTTDDTAGEKFYAEAKQIFDDAGMNLREWCSNSDALLQTIPQNDHTKSRDVKVLGLRWDSRSDRLQLQNTWDDRGNCGTKREVLQATASIYDPLGLFQPVTLRAKCFLRDLWKNKSGWDDVLCDELKAKWIELHRDVGPVFDIKIPRLIDSSDDRCLVCFADASGDAYATAIYLRSRVGHTWETNLIFAKSRLAPRQSSPTISLPRLELLGLTIAAKATVFVRRSLSTNQPLKAHMMSDSSCVLGWLRSLKPLPVFVSNRIKTIQALENVEFHHVFSRDNAADIATRGLSGSEIARSVLWWHGPGWLQYDRDRWPTNDTIDTISSEEIGRLQPESTTSPPIFHTMVAANDNTTKTPFGIDPQQYSSWQRLIRVTAQCVKAVKKLLWNKLTIETRSTHPTLDRFLGSPASENITAGDVAETKLLWIRRAQYECYAEVLEALRTAKHHQIIKRLNVELDQNGILRCCGRLDNADLPADTIRPILLSKCSAVTDLIIRDCHDKLLHAGISHTLDNIRRKFWIPQGRNAVRKVISRCRVCRRLRGPPFALPRMPQLPRERVSKSTPFQFTGVDYMGPINVSIRGETHKMWVCLFTCMAVRAVHLEHVSDCSAQCFIDCISRFIARRGCPERIISDNGPQFRLANNLFSKTWNTVTRDGSVQSYIASKGVTWKHIAEFAPWQGGFYERLVGVVKATFKAAIGRKLLPWDQFVTLVAEVEAIVNSRPLTYICSDINSALALRPCDFLADLPTGTPEIDATVRPEGGDAGKNLVRYWKQKQRRLDQVWRYWYDSYLVALREKHRTDHRQGRSSIQSSPEMSEIVLVKNTDAPRGAWKLGRVVAIVRGCDGAVRSADVRLPNHQTIRRSVGHLYRIEVPLASDGNEADAADGVNSDGYEGGGDISVPGTGGGDIGMQTGSQVNRDDDGNGVDNAGDVVVTDAEGGHDAGVDDGVADVANGGITGVERRARRVSENDEPFYGFDAAEIDFNLQYPNRHDISLFVLASRNIDSGLSDEVATMKN